MCGLSGFVGLNVDKQTKLMLVLGLADGIDDRGGHACGYAAITETKDVNYARKSGVWIRSRLRFINKAAEEISMMHARYATCGNKEDPDNAHPFAIRRNGRVVLWGAHNGMVPDAFESAKKRGRKINVDSQEIFELLADEDYAGIQNLSGYGVVTWIDADHRDHVKIARLSSQSEIRVVSIKGGGIVWASTWKILSNALQLADLEADKEFKLTDIGRVYEIRPDGVYLTGQTGVKVGTWSKWSRRVSADDLPESREIKPEDASVFDTNVLADTKDPGEPEGVRTTSRDYGYSASNPYGWGNWD